MSSLRTRLGALALAVAGVLVLWRSADAEEAPQASPVRA